MAPRPQNLDISGANASVVDNGRLIPRRPNFFMDLPSPRAGEVPPALSPLDAFALHSRALARKLEESSKAGRRMSRLPHHEIQTELAKRPGYFRSTSNESDAYSDLDNGFDDDEEEVTETDIHTSPREDRPISHYPFLGNIANDDDDNANDRPLSTIHDESPAISPAPRGEEHNAPGYFGIKVPRSSSPEPFDPQATKTEAPVSPALPSLTSSMDSIGSSQPRTLTNESAAPRNQRGLAPPRSPLHPRSPRSAASIRSVIDSGEEDNANPSANTFERARKASAASNPVTTPSPDFPPISRSPSAMSEVSINEPLQRPSFNFSRPRSNSSAKNNLAVNTNRRPSYESRTISHKHSNPSSLRDATSATQGHHTPLSARAPSHQGSDTPSGRSPSRVNDTDYQPIRSRPLRNNSGNDSDTLFVKDPSRAHLGSDTRPRLVRGPSHRSPGPSRQNSGNTTDTLSVRGPSRKNSANDGEALSFRGPSRQNSANDLDARSRRVPSRQNSAYDSDNPSMRAPSRQNSAYDSDNRSMQAPSRQNSSNNLEAMSARGPSRQNSSNNLEALSSKGPSRKNSANRNEDDWSISEADIFSGDESMYGDTREDSRAHNDLRDPEDPRAHNDPRDFRDPRDPRNTGAESYIYSKYSLPRGRTVERDSAEERKSWVHHQIKWEEGGLAAPAMKPLQEESLLSPRSDMAPPSLPTTPTKSESESAGSINRSRSAEPPGRGPSQPQHKAVPSTPSATSDSTSKTLRGRPHVRNSPSQDIAGLSPEQHLATGIEAHNAGSLSKSTYHLRLAARAGLPTAMLLYALACRHGWGMRPNQAEGVSWLKRAVDLSGSEFMTSPDVDPLSKPAPGEKPGPMTLEQKTRKAQFALAIYELGMSYNNGWGIPRDRTLALKCFEIAGSWGDNDALAEAGFCYSSGIGCKKDLKKAAGFYRRAAEGGMNMAGNSWIYKPKYMEDPVPSKAHAPAKVTKPPPSPNGEGTARPRGKSIFGRKKPPVAT